MSSKSISKSVVWQLTGKFALQGIAFFTTPIFTRILNPEDYGYAALYASWVSIFSIFIGLMTHGSIGNARVKYGEDIINSYLSSTLSISVFSFILFLVIGIVFRNNLSSLLGINQNLVILAIIQSFCGFVISFYTAKLDSFKQVEKSTLLSIIQSFLVISFSLIAVYYSNGNKALAKIYSGSIPTVLFGSFIVFYVYKNGKTVWKSDYNRFCLSLTLPLVVHGLGGLTFTQSDRIMLTKFQNEEMLGIYSVSYALCNVLVIIYGALNVAWSPFYLDFKKKGQIKELLLHSKRYIRFYTFICIGFMMLVYDVFKIMAPEKYWEGIKILPILVIAFYFGFLYLFPVNFEFYNEKTKLIPIITLFAAIINIIVNYFLIPKYSIIGASIGTLIANALLFIFHWIGARFLIKEQLFEYSPLYFIMSFVCFFVFVIIAYLLRNFFVFRWLIAITIGVFLVVDIYRNKSIF